ncbi:unnamed protein product [Allacma fusca]|uniref:Uncharacterized protein n=1 Tax=Allacma fusca TaxID=39272 RepID=A0A8J2J4P0_9HEXA|nr:unnamed protein product [Allacma fusca]
MLMGKTWVTLTLLISVLTNPGLSSPPPCPPGPCLAMGPLCQCNNQCCSNSCAQLYEGKKKNCADRVWPCSTLRGVSVRADDTATGIPGLWERLSD